MWYKDTKFTCPDVYAAKHRDLDVRLDSRSGGVFSALSDYVLKNGGVIYGCTLTERHTAVHMRAETSEERNSMRGSKYIQSDMGDLFRCVKKDLEQNRTVLFSGTSCQVAGLRGFLGEEYDNLLLVDVVCHGVCSPLVWKEYLLWQENREKSKVVGAEFRNKRDYGWAEHIETLFMLNGKRINSRVFKNLFYSHVVLRPSCYQCPYKDLIHPGNITIGDYWRINEAAPGFDDNYGVSMVLVNDFKGRAFFQLVQNSLEIVETNIKGKLQQPLTAPFSEPENRSRFWKDFHSKSFERIARRYGGYGVYNKLKRKAKGFVKAHILPYFDLSRMGSVKEGRRNRT